LDHESRLRHASYFHPIQRAAIERIAAAVSFVISAIIRHPPTPRRAVESWKSPSQWTSLRTTRDDDVDLHPGPAIIE